MEASVRKLIANRRNAKRSTGPKTPQGRAYSRRNALKHGLFAHPRKEYALLGEDPTEYDELQTELLAEYRPVGQTEELEVERIVECWWRLRRAKRYETALVHTAVRDFGRKEVERQREHCQRLDIADDKLIHMLQDAERKIAATAQVPRDFKRNLGEMSPQMESLWPSFERKADEELRNLCERAHNRDELSPEEYHAKQMWLTIVSVIEYIQQQQEFRIRGTREIAIAEHIIPDGPNLERLIRYETSIERSLARAQDRLEKLQAKRNADLVITPRKVLQSTKRGRMCEIAGFQPDSSRFFCAWSQFGFALSRSNSSRSKREKKRKNWAFSSGVRCANRSNPYQCHEFRLHLLIPLYRWLMA